MKKLCNLVSYSLKELHSKVFSTVDGSFPVIFPTEEIWPES